PVPATSRSVLAHNRNTHVDFQAGAARPAASTRARHPGPPSPPAGAPGSGPGARGGRRTEVTRHGGGEGSPAPLTRPGAAPGPSLRRSRSKTEKGGGGGRGERPGSSFHPETGGPAGNDEGRGRPGPVGNRVPRVRPRLWGKEPRAEQPGRVPPPEPAAPMPGGYGVMGDDGSMDYSVHEAWNEATNVYLVVILVSFVLFMYAKSHMTPGAAGPLTAWTPGWLREGSTHHRQFTCRNKRKIMRIFSVPPTAETLSEPSFYDTISKIRLRQQLEMYSIYHLPSLVDQQTCP
uniref:Small integral membrane protein 19 n=1 Tax=Felis catus TaxID=9685 RepID=A0ABI7Z9P8_FELCA